MYWSALQSGDTFPKQMLKAMGCPPHCDQSGQLNCLGPFSSAAGLRTMGPSPPSALTLKEEVEKEVGGACVHPGTGFFFFYWVSLRWTPLRHPPSTKATGGQGFKCHAWPSERPAPGSCLLGEARRETGIREREDSQGEGGPRPSPIVHCDRHVLLTDSKSSVSSRHAPWPCPAQTQRALCVYGPPHHHA